MPSELHVYGQNLKLRKNVKKKKKKESDPIPWAFIWVSGVMKWFFLSPSLHSDQIRYSVITNFQYKKIFGFKVTEL